MEEIVTVDGKQFKLTTDQPLTAQQKEQTIAEIRKQSGCGTCGQPRALSTGGVYSLPFGNDGAGTNSAVGKGSGSAVTLKATPNGGVGPYDVRFWKSLDGATIGQVGSTYLGQPEGSTVTDSYTLLDTDVYGATGNSAALAPSDVTAGNGVITVSGGSVPLVAGSIRFYTSIVDSCTGASKGTCAQYVDVAITCIAPTCGFIVS